MRRAMTPKLHLALGASLGALALAAPAIGQEADAEGRQIEQITVKAQQREETAQSVPVSIGVYDTERVENAGVQDIKDLITIAPGLMVTSTQSETITTARIRGIGTVGDNYGLESSVGMLIDGVFISRNGVGFNDLGEIERVEILRGPQGTLFGKNTSAGVISVFTKDPQFEYETSGEVTIGDFGLQRYAGSFTGAVSEDAAVRLYAVRQQRDGYNDLIIGKGADAEMTDSDNSDFVSIRGSLLYNVFDDLTLRINGDYADRDELCCSAVQWNYGATGAAFVGSVGGQVLSPADPERRLGFSNVPYIQQVEDYGLSANFELERENFTLTSITAWREWDNKRSQDIDYSSADIAFRQADRNTTEIDRLTQEVRLNGQAGRLDWLVGGYYSDEDLVLGDAIQFGADWEAFLGRLLTASSVPPLGTSAGVSATISSLTGGAISIPPGSAIPNGSGVNQDIYTQSSESWSIFTHNTFAVTDRLDLTLGLRWTSEDKSLDATFDTASVPGCAALEGAFGFDPVGGFVAFATANGFPASTISGGVTAIGNICLPYARTGLDATGYDQSLSEEELSGLFRVSYALTDDVLGYAGYSRGYKAGGFNLDRQFNGPIGANGYVNVNTAFLPELTDAYEIGIKSQLFNRSMQLNANIFHQKIEDFQLNTFQGTAFVVDSVPEVTSQGFELDVVYLPPIDGLDLFGGFAYVDAFYGDNLTTPSGAPLLVGGNSLDGKQISLSPETFVTGGFTYAFGLTAGLGARINGDARYVSEYNTGSDLDPQKVQDAFTLYNAAVAIGPDDERWSFEVWGRNLSDETYAQVAFDAFAQPGGFDAFLGAPRTYGATLKAKF